LKRDTRLIEKQPVYHQQVTNGYQYLPVKSVMGSDRGRDVAVKCPKDVFFKDKNMGEGNV